MQGFGNTMSNLPEDKSEISIYFSMDKDFIALAKESIQIMRYIFFLFLEEDTKALLMSTQNIFSLRNKKNVNFRASKSWLNKWI